ncbi:hypothetical protein E1292_02825 [Nonomuraea deserti]|uniref:Uncharacterized protein n=1 Tax=Nonomuraea deserti TaxID=1848322 RepID=A0A4R4W8J0_9ACTN|nr:hypothetical protein [Nonomuraea deserti]TDD12074.1 hypothetical protein E1292_02825 [Nonomuraea deserti]
MMWIERTAYPQFERLTSARVLRVFSTPSPEEVDRAEERRVAGERAPFTAVGSPAPSLPTRRRQ